MRYKRYLMHFIQKDSTVVLLGYASITYKLNDVKIDTHNYWKIHSSWKVDLAHKKIKLWQVYADNSIVLEIMHKNK